MTKYFSLESLFFRKNNDKPETLQMRKKSKPVL